MLIVSKEPHGERTTIECRMEGLQFCDSHILWLHGTDGDGCGCIVLAVDGLVTDSGPFARKMCVIDRRIYQSVRLRKRKGTQRNRSGRACKRVRLVIDQRLKLI
jgi:hypothetical protein